MSDLITYLEIGAFISCIIAWNKIKNSNYMRLFPFLLFIIAAGELYGYYVAVKYGNNLWFYNLMDPIMYTLYFTIMYFSIKNISFKKFILISSIIYILVSCVTYFLYCYGKGVFNLWMYILGAVILIICLLFKLYELLEDPVDLDFLKRPFFYIIIFTLLFYTVTIPNFAMDNWMANAKMKRLTDIIDNVSDFLNVLLYASYTIVFLWIRKAGIY